ncbi:MAG TPA: hypothetical protein VF460_07155 [Burkholderiales bacterium]
MATRKIARTTKVTVRTRAAGSRKAATVRKTAKAGSAAATLSPEQIGQVIELIKGANSVELKLSVPVVSHQATIKAIGLDPVEAQPRQAFFFDTPDLALNRAGLVVRVRRTQGGTADTVIKLRPVDPATIDKELRRSDSFKVEVDVMPGGFVCSASFKGVCPTKDARDVAAGLAPVSSLFSKEQRAFFKAHAPAKVNLDKLTVLGPTFVLKAKHQPKDFDRRIVVEMWLYPDGSRILEVSTKGLPVEAFQVAATFKAYLAKLGVSLAAKQETKTKAALDFYRAKVRSDLGGVVPAAMR